MIRKIILRGRDEEVVEERSEWGRGVVRYNLRNPN